MRKNMKGKMMYNLEGVYGTVNIDNLPSNMDVEILLDIGENSNANQIAKLSKIGAEVLPALNSQGVGMVIKPEAPAILATKLIEAMNLDSNDFLEDYTTDEFKQKASETIQKQSQDADQMKQIEQKKAMADSALAEANVTFTQAQTKNTEDDNAKQLAVSIDKHFQEWADLNIKAVKEGAQLPEHPNYAQIIMMAKQILKGE